MKETTCQWCKKPFENDDKLVKFCSYLCRDYQNGWVMAQEWIAKQPDPGHEEKMRKIRRETVQKINHVVQFAPPVICRHSRYGKGKYE